MARLVVCTPSTGRVSLSRERSMMRLAVQLERRGFDFRPDKDCWDNTMPGRLDHARNCLLYRVSEELDDGDWAWWQDADVAVAPQLIFDMMAREELIVARAYPLKPDYEHGVGWSGFPLRDQSKRLVLSEDRMLIEAVGFGFGAVMMKPAAARMLREHCGVRGLGGQAERSIPAFDTLDDHRGNTCLEDMSFALRWRQQLGQRMWIAPEGVVQNGDVAGSFLESLRGAST